MSHIISVVVPYVAANNNSNPRGKKQRVVFSKSFIEHDGVISKEKMINESL